jgi:hypothetical protein
MCWVSEPVSMNESSGISNTPASAVVDRYRHECVNRSSDDQGLLVLINL